MPVVVTGAGGLIGRALLRRLAPLGGEVRALVRSARHLETLRALVPKTATADLEDVETLALMLHDAHTVIHLAGGLDLPDAEAYDAANRATAEAAIEAAETAGVRRFVLVSSPGASASAKNAYLRAKGRAEDALAGSSVPERVVVRSTHVYGAGSSWLAAMRSLARPPVALVPGTGAQQLAPVHADDVAAILARADDRDTEVAGTFGLEGPDVVTMAAFVERLAGRPRRVLGIAPDRAARLARLVGRRLSPVMLEVLAADSRADAPGAAAEFGVTLASLDEGLARS
jgi:uncharacterized protein YbjT (DUF2867 family)